MVLSTYRINQRRLDLRRKLEFMRDLSKSPLKKDNFWHFFLDPEGATLRFQPKIEKKVQKWLEKNADKYNLTWRKRTNYEPRKHEYYGVSFLGDDILPLFHELSVLTTKYPPYVLLRSIFERLNHGFINMAGIHDFTKEADLYLDLAWGRIKLAGFSFPLPKWFYKVVIWLSKEKRKLKL